jgi:DNA-binding transcriptional MerR regulator
LHPELVDVFVRYQLVEPIVHTSSCPLFPTSSIERLKRILRLRHEMGVNLAGISVILDMAEQIENLETDLEMLRNQLRQPKQ